MVTGRPDDPLVCRPGVGWREPVGEQVARAHGVHVIAPQNGQVAQVGGTGQRAHHVRVEVVAIVGHRGVRTTDELAEQTGLNPRHPLCRRAVARPG
jgi:hypothetical protein